MPTYTYRGLTKEQMNASLKARMDPKAIKWPEKRGEPSRYTFDTRDNERRRAEKEANRKAFLAKLEAEMKASLEKDDAAASFMDPDTDKPLVFKKGEPVTIREGHPLVAKLDTLSGVGMDDGVRRAWSKGEDKGKKEQKEPKA